MTSVKNPLVSVTERYSLASERSDGHVTSSHGSRSYGSAREQPIKIMGNRLHGIRDLG